MADEEEYFITTKPDKFIDHLAPGDVILFDSISLISALIKFAEARPTNHSGLYLGDGEFAHVEGESEEHPAAARQASLHQLLSTPYDTTVTALRHVDVAAGADAENVVARARRYVDEGDTTYAYLSLLALTAPGLLRSYDLYMSQGKAVARHIRSKVETLSDAIVTIFDPEIDGAHQGLQSGKKSLTCSEFVFRSFLEADPPMPISLPDPLFSLAPVEAPDPGAGAGAGALAAGHDRDAEPSTFIVEFHESIASALADDGDGDETGPVDLNDDDAFWNIFADRDAGGGGPVANPPWLLSDRMIVPSGVTFAGALDLGPVFGDRGLGGAHTRRQMAGAALRVAWNLVAHNGELDKYGTFRPGAIEAEKVLPDTVTPKDLWSSTSLTTVAQLHRLPRHVAGLDMPHHH